MDDYTRKFNAAEDKDQQVHYILTTVYESLKEKGYDPINQIVGYILSEDPTYITNHNSARTLICKIDRDELLQVLVKSYLELSNNRKNAARSGRAAFFSRFLPISAQLSEFFLPVRVDSRSQMCYNLVTKIATEVYPWQK